MVFKFNFQTNSSDDGMDSIEVDVPIEEIDGGNHPELTPAQEFDIKELGEPALELGVVKIEGTPFAYNKSTQILKRLLADIKLQLAQEDSMASESAEELIRSWMDGQDVVTHVYEGGFKTWESAIDLSTFLLNQSPDTFNEKTIIELGCGSGVPSLALLRNFRPSRLHFCDYNKEVLRLATAPNLAANVLAQNLNSDGDIPLDLEITSKLLSQLSSTDRFRFFFGDWAGLPSIISTTHEPLYDVVLTTETLYTLELIPKLYNTLLSLMAKPHGVAYVAAKTVYFGCGGGTLQFKELVNSGNLLTCQVGWSTHSGVAREVLVLRWK
ncbi:hypothetical protein DSO57_1039359 [Entomophthora muscae]|uniref:Uncharacterized protein n=1 Tax=Entomophthora muscae TaxID=34485 RepID=A0ACC2TX04_9FUNG|nr:hypothetical protein DSO57_1039359 [Entomophthora muscae]